MYMYVVIDWCILNCHIREKPLKQKEYLDKDQLSYWLMLFSLFELVTSFDYSQGEGECEVGCIIQVTCF